MKGAIPLQSRGALAWFQQIFVVFNIWLFKGESQQTHLQRARQETSFSSAGQVILEPLLDSATDASVARDDKKWVWLWPNKTPMDINLSFMCH